MPRTIPDIESLIARLPITTESFGIYEALLTLPYDIYKPILGMLFDGTITHEDLVDTVGAASAAGRASADSTAAQNRYNSSLDVSSEALAQRCIALIGGSPAGAVALPRDTSAVGVGPSGEPGGGVFVPSAPTVVSSDLANISPNPIEIERAGGDLVRAQQASQQAVQAAINGEIR